ncbi:MAG: J domain-containing protein [Myxococcota bacterium]
MTWQTQRTASTATVIEFCLRVRSPDPWAYLNLGPSATPSDALSALEERRDWLRTRVHQGTGSTSEAEALEKAYDALRIVLSRGDASQHWEEDLPDYYRMLGVLPDASYTTIERAFQSLQESERPSGDVLNAWKVLSDPIQRSRYDRIRTEHRPTRPSDHGTHPDESLDSILPRLDTCSARIIGPAVREILLHDHSGEVGLPFEVTGDGRYRAKVHVDHPAIETRPPKMIAVGPGRHTLTMLIDRSQVRGDVEHATVTLRGPDGTHRAVLALKRADGRRWNFLSQVTVGLLIGMALFGVGWAFGPRVSNQVKPMTIGNIDQLSNVAACLTSVEAPPAHLDVRVAAMGRPIGFAFDTPVGIDVDTCVQQGLIQLAFPPLRHQSHGVHRYLVPPRPEPTP